MKTARHHPSIARHPLLLVLGTMASLICVRSLCGKDLLRPGNTAGSTQASTAVYGATSANTAQAQAHANDILARTTMALQSVQAMQAAARALAQGQNNLGADPNHPGSTLPNVPNGLATGGLVPSVIPWQNANAPTQTINNGQYNVNVTQTGQQALLNWSSFNIGKNTNLNIDQSAGGSNASQWIAFNIVNDPSGIPSQILGSISALGQVYLINQNGIIFGGASQVNVNTLVASSLPINTNLISRGLLNNPDDQFLFSQLTIKPVPNGTMPEFDPPAPNTPATMNGRDGDVTVQAGAQINAALSGGNVGGRVALIGPNVTNAGVISTPEGQTILAAGDQVALTAHPSSDPTLRGLDTYVGSVDSFSGNATNTGLISAPQGDIMMVGSSVNQLGALESTTTVSLNGRIDLLANYNAVSGSGTPGVAPFLPQSTGNVTLGAGSVIQIMPDISSGATVVGTSLALTSVVNIQGYTIYMGQNSVLQAPSANVLAGDTTPLDGNGTSLSSGVTLSAGVWDLVASGNTPSSETFVHSGGQIYLDSNATIDVAGSENVNASVTENIVSAQLRGSELENSPLQRNGVLRGATVNVDISQYVSYGGQEYVGTALANVQGYANLVAHTVGELTIAGGSVSLSAGNSVVMQQGSAINVSGGWINYQGGMVQTTKLVGTDGHIYDISQATPNITYQGILGGFTQDYSKWGITETFATPLLGGPYYDAGYIQGGNGGSISITAPGMALDGNLYGSTVAGPRQRSVGPDYSALSLAFDTFTFSSNPQSYSPTPPTVVIENGVTLPSVGAFALDSSGNPLPLPADRLNEVVLSPDIVGLNAFGVLNISNGDGNIILPAGSNMTAPMGGSITLSGANIDIEGNITAPGGQLSFVAYNISPFESSFLTTPPPNSGRGDFTLGAGASLSTAGLLVNDLPDSAAPMSLPLFNNENGGSISIAGYNLDLAAGSSINASGGAAISTAGKISYGTGGGITLLAGNDPGIASVIGGGLVLGASLEGYSGGKGGSLTIQAPAIQIGGATSNALVLLLSPNFLSQGGFAGFTLETLGAANPDLYIVPGTQIEPVSENWVVTSVSNGGVALVPLVEPVGVRTPVSISLNAQTINGIGTGPVEFGNALLGNGAVIQTDPGGKVSINGFNVAILGSIYTPGGSITVSGAGTSPTGATDAVVTVDIGPGSVLSAAGTLVLTPDPSGHGYLTGSVLPGGSISISGNIVAEAGAILDVSGASGLLDLPASDSGQNPSLKGSFLGASMIATEEYSNGGSITLSGAQELYTDATLIGRAGGPSAIGGTLTVGSSWNFGAAQNTVLNPTLLITQSGLSIPVGFYPAGQTAIGYEVISPVDSHGNPNYVTDANGNPLYVINSLGNPVYGVGHLTADSFNKGGFTSLVLQGTVEFEGNVTLSAPGTMDIATNGILYANGIVNLNAPYVAIGTSFDSPAQQLLAPHSSYTDLGKAYAVSPTYGSGILNVTGGQIDIGSLSLQNIGEANFTAPSGDIRGDGTLDVAGNVTLTAGQIYPPTEVFFTIAAYNDILVASSVADSNTVTLASPVLPAGFGIGSTLFGYTVQSISGVTVTLAPLSPTKPITHLAVTANTEEAYNPAPGSSTSGLSIVTINQTGNAQLPLSAGGVLNIYAPVIIQDGVLRAPIGTINLGWNGVGTAPTDQSTQAGVEPTLSLTLGAGSVTSVSAIDPTTGQPLVIPYGTNLNGTDWIDPAGVDITTSGLPAKTINLSAVSVMDQAGAVVDLSGGGDLYAYRFVSGLGGTVDILSSPSSFAVIPGYNNGSLNPGQKIYLAASNGLPAGFYTILPATDALLPGGFLVTPAGGSTVGAASVQPDGSSIVPGYRLVAGQGGQPLFTNFVVDSQSVVENTAEYDNFYANSFFKQAAATAGISAPRLPVDAGQLVIDATKSMALFGSVNSQSTGGLGGLVDINSPEDILINSTGVDNSFNGLVLDATTLSNFGAGSLLIGGQRQVGSAGTTVSVTTNNITVDNSGAPLTGQDVILAANDSITVDPSAKIESSGASSNAAQNLLLGNSATPGSGDGVLLRVSSNPSVQIFRSGVDTFATQAGFAQPITMTIGAGATISGASVTLDSTYATNLDPTASVTGNSLSFNSGQITLVLGNVTPAPTVGLELTAQELSSLLNAQSLSLLSYSSIDVYGSGVVGASGLANLSLHTAEIRSFDNTGNGATFEAQNILIDNSANTTGLGSVISPLPAGTSISFNAGAISLGANQTDVDQAATVNLNATGGVISKSSGELAAAGDLQISAPVVTGAAGSNETIMAGNSAQGGALTITPIAGGNATVTAGLGATLDFQTSGAGITVDSNILAPSGKITIHATGNITMGDTATTLISAAGTAQTFFDLVEYTGGGQINLASDTGGVNVASNATIDVSSPGNAGSLSISAPTGEFQLTGQLDGHGGSIAYENGTISLDVGTIAGQSLSVIDAILAAGGFTESVTIRDRNDVTLTIDGMATAHTFNVSTDNGSITVSGTINASGTSGAGIANAYVSSLTGGSIDLEAHDNVIIQSGALLTVVGSYYNDAGRGGSVTLAAGDETNGSAPVATQSGNTFTTTSNGYLDVQTNSTINLAVLHQLTTSDLTLGNTTDNRTDLAAGTLHLRAPMTTNGADVQINPINGSINGASSITVEGYKVYTTAGGSIDSFESQIKTNGITFAGAAGTTTTGYTNMQGRLFANNSGLESIAYIEPGAEIVNTTGDLTLAKNWDLSSYRFGPNSAAGDLTLRAKGNLVFNFGASLSDGFGSTSDLVSPSDTVLWEEGLAAVGSQSWSYRLVAGADFAGAAYSDVLPIFELASGKGSLILGGLTNDSLPSGVVTSRLTVLATYFQTIRTGVGSINIDTGRDLQFTNPLATIYTAGSRAADLAGFQVFVPKASDYTNSNLGTTSSPFYLTYYSQDGGNVNINAQNNIEDILYTPSGVVYDSTEEMPSNWLYRRGDVSSSGVFQATRAGNEIASTTWWVDFSNFFEGVGALGGGNVSMIAGHDIINVDAVVPTNARMPGVNSSNNPIAPNAANLLELGGGDLLVQAGNNINGGVYYVERGIGTLTAGNQILTNSARAAVFEGGDPTDSSTWLPTTLFLGEGSFDITAGGSVLLGPVVNPFLLPEGVYNSYQNKAYFSTYGSTDVVNVSSLQGDVTIADDTDNGNNLLSWYQNALLYTSSVNTYAIDSEPWVKLDETNLSTFNFNTNFSLMPPTLRVEAFSGDINLLGTLLLSPSATGNVDLLAAGSINGMQPNVPGQWGSSVINLSDANPANIPGIATPLSDTGVTTSTTLLALLLSFDQLFNDSGSITGFHAVLQTEQALHDQSILHAGDTNPVHLYADSGDISGVTLYSPKVTDVIAGADITDIAFYIQNTSAADVSLVAAGGDIIPFDPNSPLRIEAQQTGFLLGYATGSLQSGPGSGEPTAGDIQIAGPGTLEVLAGKNLNLGIGPNNADGTGAGITSIGNAANPALPAAGAGIIAAAGIGPSFGLPNSQLNFTGFISEFIDPATAGAYSNTYLPDLASVMAQMNLPAGSGGADTWADYQALTAKQQDILALDIFYFVLRDAGSNYSVTHNYAAGYQAIAALIPLGNSYPADISLTSREIKTINGGDIDLLDPSGSVNVGLQIAGTQAIDQGILTQSGGNINIYTYDSVNVGTSRIFTLDGGNEIIWSTVGNIDAGNSSKTVQSAPPTRVLIDPQSGAVQTDRAGLATGGGIGVLASFTGAGVSNVSLIAPAGIVNAGDAGIRASGNITIAAAEVENAGNIASGGVTTGTPPPPAAPNIAGLAGASNTAAAGSSAANDVAKQQQNATQGDTGQDIPSIITVEVLGYGGGDSTGQVSPDDKEKKGRKELRDAANSTLPTASEPPLAMADER